MTPERPSSGVVFVVDDDDSVRRALARLLASAGYRVQTFPSAEEFLARRPALATEGPACAVLDVRLPGLSGVDLQRGLRQGGDRLPVVFITGHGDIALAV